MPRVWFIRHGESESNADLPTTHPADSPLTPRGFAESDTVVDCFPEKPSLVVTSPYLRARQTAEPTIAHFAPIPVEEWPVQEFTYLHPDKYLSTTGTERWPDIVEYWERGDPIYKDGGDGESFVELMARVTDTLRRLKVHPAEFIALFSHGIFLRALYWAWMTGTSEATADSMRRLRQFIRSVDMPNTAIVKATFLDDGPTCFGAIETTHLKLA